MIESRGDSPTGCGQGRHPAGRCGCPAPHQTPPPPPPRPPHQPAAPPRAPPPGAICIVHTVRLPAKTLFAIQLPVAGQRNLKAIYVVKHCEPLDAGLFRIGAALLKLDDPQGIVSMSHPNLMGKAEGKAESKGPAAGAEDAETPEKAKLAEAVLAGK